MSCIVLSFAGVAFVFFRLRLFAFIDAAALRSIVLRYACAPATTRRYDICTCDHGLDLDISLCCENSTIKNQCPVCATAVGCTSDIVKKNGSRSCPRPLRSAYKTLNSKTEYIKGYDGSPSPTRYSCSREKRVLLNNTVDPASAPLGGGGGGDERPKKGERFEWIQVHRHSLVEFPNDGRIIGSTVSRSRRREALRYIVHCTLTLIHCTLTLIHCTLTLIHCTLYTKSYTNSHGGKPTQGTPRYSKNYDY